MRLMKNLECTHGVSQIGVIPVSWDLWGIVDKHIPSKFLCQSSNPQCVSINMWGLWEVTGISDL